VFWGKQVVTVYSFPFPRTVYQTVPDCPVSRPLPASAQPKLFPGVAPSVLPKRRMALPTEISSASRQRSFGGTWRISSCGSVVGGGVDASKISSCGSAVGSCPRISSTVTGWLDTEGTDDIVGKSVGACDVVGSSLIDGAAIGTGASVWDMAGMLLTEGPDEVAFSPPLETVGNACKKLRESEMEE